MTAAPFHPATLRSYYVCTIVNSLSLHTQRRHSKAKVFTSFLLFFLISSPLSLSLFRLFCLLFVPLMCVLVCAYACPLHLYVCVHSLLLTHTRTLYKRTHTRSVFAALRGLWHLRSLLSISATRAGARLRLPVCIVA